MRKKLSHFTDGDNTTQLTLLQETDRQPYVYHLWWTEHNRGYIGARYGKKCNPTDLLTTYFTSSVKVKSFIDKYGLPDIVLKKSVMSVDEAKMLEGIWLIKYNAVKDDRYFNKWVMTHQGNIRCASNDPEIRAKMSKNIRKGKNTPTGRENHRRGMLRWKYKARLMRYINRKFPSKPRYEDNVYIFTYWLTNQHLMDTARLLGMAHQSLSPHLKRLGLRDIKAVDRKGKSQTKSNLDNHPDLRRLIN